MYPHKLPLDDLKDPKDAHANFNFSCEIQGLPINSKKSPYWCPRAHLHLCIVICAHTDTHARVKEACSFQCAA